MLNIFIYLNVKHFQLHNIQKIKICFEQFFFDLYLNLMKISEYTEKNNF